MCGKFVLISDWSKIAGEFGLEESNQTYTPRGDIYPAAGAACIVSREGKNTCAVLHWGYAASWKKQSGRSGLIINARGETLSQKPAFRDAFRKRRCLIAADGFYEWSKEKIQYEFTLRSNKLLGLAGLYEEAIVSGDTGASFVIITTSPNELVSSVHNRMPAIIPESKYALWLDNSRYDENRLQELLIPYPASDMSMRGVNGSAPRI